MFMGTLQVQFMENMAGASFPAFSDVITVKERIDSHVKKGKLSCDANTLGGGKNPYSIFQKKKECEAHAIIEGLWNRAQ